MSTVTSALKDQLKPTHRGPHDVGRFVEDVATLRGAPGRTQTWWNDVHKASKSGDLLGPAYEARVAVGYHKAGNLVGFSVKGRADGVIVGQGPTDIEVQIDAWRQIDGKLQLVEIKAGENLGKAKYFDQMERQAAYVTARADDGEAVSRHIAWRVLHEPPAELIAHAQRLEADYGVTIQLVQDPPPIATSWMTS